MGWIPPQAWRALPALPLVAAVRVVGRSWNEKQAWFNFSELFGLVGTDPDLRQLAAAMEATGVKPWLGRVSDLKFNWQRSKLNTPEHVWPFYAEHPERLEEALGLRPSTRRYFNKEWELGRGLTVLALFPTLPKKYLPVVTEVATRQTKTSRREAQQLLESRLSREVPELAREHPRRLSDRSAQPNVLAVATDALGCGQGDVRAAAADWLARIGDRAAVGPLRAALAKEKQEAVQAAILSALNVFGDDISAYLTRERLAADAAKGLGGRRPSGADWLTLRALPDVNWADGTPVERAVVEWWALLAVKLKDPAGAGLIPLHLSLLSLDSRAALGTYVLDAWIAQDTLHPDEQACREYADAEADSRYQRYQADAKRWPQYYAAKGQLTHYQVWDELRREKGRE